jgi:salicylate hydroxylase
VAGRPVGPVLIAGAGIAGLATAIALATHGLASRVLERAAAFGEAGAGIQIGPNGVRALQALGVADIVEPKTGQPDEIRIHQGHTGRVLAVMPLGGTIAARLGAPYWTAHRADLHAALLARARALSALIAIEPGFEVARIEASGPGVRAFARSGATAAGSALVGADGLWSTVRAYVADPKPLRAVGRTASRTVIPTGDAPATFRANATGLWLAPGAHVVHYPIRGGAGIAVVVIMSDATASDGWTRDAGSAGAGLVARIAGLDLDPGLRAFLATAMTWQSWSLYHCAPLARWSNGRVVLTGDAAHPVLPFLAQGGVMALEDALVLARQIASNSGDVPAAFAAFEAERRPRVSRVAAASRRNGGLYHLSGPAAFSRNLVLTMLGGSRLIGSYDWLYGWRAP